MFLLFLQTTHFHDPGCEAGGVKQLMDFMKIQQSRQEWDHCRWEPSNINFVLVPLYFRCTSLLPIPSFAYVVEVLNCQMLSSDFEVIPSVRNCRGSQGSTIHSLI